MKRWLERILRREHWVTRAARLGLEAYAHESTGARPGSPPADDRSSETEPLLSPVEAPASIP